MTNATAITEPKANWEHRHYARRIGTFHQREIKTYGVPQEYAGARLEIEVPAGDYAVEICKSNNYVYLRIVLPGTQIHYSWHSDHCHRADNERKPYTYHSQRYGYELAALVKRGDVTLDDPRYSVHELEHTGMIGRVPMAFLAFEGVQHPAGIACVPGYANEIGFNPFDDVTV